MGDAIAEDQRYQATERPTGIIFGFGVVIGVLVGIVIVYQVLSTDVADHMREYATFKAIGYPHRYFIGVILEEALILATLGFVPGIVIATVLYTALNAATGLPLEMTVQTASVVFAGTLVACALSGAIATRRLAAADPADLF
jgi:putative ABC transport system permease protein